MLHGHEYLGILTSGMNSLWTDLDTIVVVVILLRIKLHYIRFEL